MIFLTLAEAKTQLRVTSSSEDAHINVLIAAACRLCEEFCNREFDTESAPESVKYAALLMVSDFYVNRETHIVGAVNENQMWRELLWSSINFGGADSSDEPAAIDMVFRGDTFILDFQWKQENGDPVNMTGYTVSVTLDQTPYTATIADAVQGLVSVTLSAHETQNIGVGSAALSLRATSPAGVVTTLSRRLVEFK